MMTKKKWMSYMLAGMMVMGQASVYAETLPNGDAAEGVRKLQYDVVVAGSDPEGITAAVSAARSGANVLLVDTRGYAGGLYTSGMLSMLDLNYKDSKNDSYVNDGFFNEFYGAVGVNASFDIDDTKEYFHKLLESEGVDTVWQAQNVEPIMKGNTTQGVSFIKGRDAYMIESDVVIDAMIDAPVARKAGAPYYVGREDLGKHNYAAATLVFSVDNVDWDKVHHYLTYDGDIYTGTTANTGWGYKELLSYEPVTSDRFQLRALNLSRQTNGEVVINAFQIFNVDSLDEEAKRKAYEEAKAEIPYVIEYMRNHAVGFENATLGRVADELYIREGVRIVGEQTLVAEDVFTNKDYDNKIAYGSYPMDLQSAKRDSSGGTILSGRNLYTVPLGITIPKEVEGMMVVGRSASFDSISHSSARTVPVGMGVAEGVGIAAALASKGEVTPREVYNDITLVKGVQEELVRRGVSLYYPLPNHHPEIYDWSYPYIQSLRQQALLSMERNYKNSFNCDQRAKFIEIERIIQLMHVNSNLVVGDVSYLKHEDNLTHQDFLDVINAMTGNKFDSLRAAREVGVLDELTFNKMNSSEVLNNSHLYAMMHGVITYLREVQGQPLPDRDQIVHTDK